MDGHLSVTCYPDLGAIPAGTWSKLSSEERLFHSAAWFEINADAVSEQRWFLLVCEQDRPLLLCPAFLLTQPAGYAYFDIWQIVGGATLFTDDAPSLHTPDWQPHLVVGVPYGYCTPVLIAEGLAQHEQHRTFDALLDGLFALAHQHGASCIAFLYMPAADPLLHYLLQAGAGVGLVMAEAVLSLRDQSWEQYLKGLGGHRRQRILAEIRSAEQKGLQVAVEAPGSEAPHLLAHMEAELFRRYGYQGDMAAWEEWYARLLRLMDRRVRLYLCRREGQPVGYSLFLQEGGVWYAKATGYRYGLLTPHDYAYFQTIYYAPIRDAIACGAQAIHFGAGAYDAKLRRGCGLRALHGAVLPVQPAAAPMKTMLQEYQALLYDRLLQLAQSHDKVLEGIIS